MTRKECEDVLKVLKKIKDPDGNVEKAILIVNKQIAEFNSRKGQLKEMYEYEREY